MQIIRKPSKPLIVVIIIILAIALLIAIAAGGLYLFSETVRFDHRDTSEAYAPVSYEQPEGYSVNYPFFGNSLTLSGGTGRSCAFVFGVGGEKNIWVYNAVNEPIDTWVDYLATRYKRHVNLNYDLEQDSKSITVTFKGNAADDEETVIPLEQKFVFDIENASSDTLPQWINKDEASADYKEYLNYLENPDVNPMPDWYQQMLQKTE
ncbi:MAG: hypothetical protein NC203_07145 [Firmicutes bacterium]|nr:hypothetical protein [[Eubacterium] siraeum]MCM1488125.1 hypothetical protein [Bacillota bacterium]